MKIKLASVLAASMLSFGSMSVYASSSAPSSTVESEVHPAANVCGFSYNKRPGSEMTRYNAGLQVSGTGSIMVCALPVKYDRFIERVVFDVMHHGVSQRSCSLSYANGTSGSVAASGSKVYMNYNTSAAVNVWQYDSFGTVPAYNGGNPQNMLLVSCEHYNMTGSQFVRYGAIRIDYSQQ